MRENRHGISIGIPKAVELLCTTRLPAFRICVPTLKQLDRLIYYEYMALDNLADMFDDVIVLAIGGITINHFRPHQREDRWLKVISGPRMVGLGIVLLL